MVKCVGMQRMRGMSQLKPPSLSRNFISKLGFNLYMRNMNFNFSLIVQPYTKPNFNLAIVCYFFRNKVRLIKVCKFIFYSRSKSQILANEGKKCIFLKFVTPGFGFKNIIGINIVEVLL